MENSAVTPTTTTTSTKKRRHSEYHDPDYGFGNEKVTTDSNVEKRVKREQKQAEDTEKQYEKKIIVPTVDSMAKLKRIEEIIRTEFQKELTLKEEQLNEIDARLLQARNLLDKLRYNVVSEYYKKQQVPLTAPDVARVRSSDTLFGDTIESAGAQLPLHPAIKKIVGKRPAPMHFNLPERTAATLAKQTIRLRNPAHRRAERRRQQKIREQGIVTDHSKEKPTDLNVTISEELPCTSRQAAIKQQMELEASVPALNTSRLNNKNKFYFVVGNTSKYLGSVDSDPRDSQALTYKWLVYVQGKNLPQPPETYLKKVRFQLHHSYRPNDIVDVHSPPFQLTRRGWGEFPMRIQLYFQEHLQQKPVQLMHNIVLDKTMCGLHTMGGETTVEVWLRADVPETTTTTKTTHPMEIKKEPLAATPAMKPLSPTLEGSKPRTISITQNKEDLDDNLFAGINKIELSDDIEQIEPTVLVSEQLKLSSPKKQKPIAPPESVHDLKPTLAINGVDSCVNKSQQLRNGHSKSQVKNVVFQKAGKLYIIDPLQTKLKQAAKQQSLLKPQLSLLKPPTQQLSRRWHLLQCIQNDHGYANMSSQEVQPALPAPSLSQRQRVEQRFCATHFQSMRSALEFLLRRLPLTNMTSMGSEYTFGRHSLTAFKAEPALRQRFYEIMRGRVLLRCMRQHLRLQHLHASGKESFWSTREIVAFARLHGYTPPLKMLSVSRQSTDSGSLPLSERVQQQLKEDPQPQLLSFSTLTSRSRLDSWLVEQTKRLQGREQHIDDQQSVDVVGLNPSTTHRTRPPNITNSLINRQLLYLPPPEELDTATQLVRDMCKDVGIVLNAEPSVPGVTQSLALTVLAHVLQIFIGKLVRRSLAAKLEQQQQPQHAIDRLPPAAANVEVTLLPQDIGRVIANCTELDFLGNYNLGIEHTDADVQS